VRKFIVAQVLKTIDKIPFAPVVAVAFGVVSAALVFAVPDWRFSQAVTASGLPEILSAARPPLGDTARGLVAIALGLGVGIVLWALLSVIGRLVKARRPKRVKAKGVRIDPVATPVNVNTPHRRPIFAERDLGAPFMSDEIVANVAPVAEPDELVLETAWAEPEAVVALIEPDPEPVEAVEAPAPTLAFATTATQNNTPEPSVGDLMARLEIALAKRASRGKPAGDIASLRQALNAM
jgi:hypothetical protein